MTIRNSGYIGAMLGFGRDNRLRDVVIDGVAGRDKYAIGVNGIGENGGLTRITVRNLDNTDDEEAVAVLISAGDEGTTLRDSRLQGPEGGDDIGVWVADGASLSIQCVELDGFERPVAAVGTVVGDVTDAGGAKE